MFSPDTFKRPCFPLVSTSMPSNTNDRRVSNDLTPKARGYNNSTKRQFYTVTTISRTSKCGRGPTNNIAFAISQKAKRLDLYKLKSSSQNGLYSGERLREYGVKFCKGNELSDARPGKAKRELHCFVMKLIYTAVIVKKKHCEKIQDCQCKQTERP